MYAPQNSMPHSLYTVVVSVTKLTSSKINLISGKLLAKRNRYASTPKIQEGSTNPTHARNTKEEQIQTSIIACAGRDANGILTVCWLKMVGSRGHVDVVDVGADEVGVE
jgi:hypothetical protein